MALVDLADTEGVLFRVAAVFENQVVADGNAFGEENMPIGAAGAEEEKHLIAVAKFSGSSSRYRLEPQCRRVRRIRACGRQLPGQQKPYDQHRRERDRAAIAHRLRFRCPMVVLFVHGFGSPVARRGFFLSSRFSLQAFSSFVVNIGAGLPRPRIIGLRTRRRLIGRTGVAGIDDGQQGERDL